ncbi:hypothetical protein DRO91_08235 [Candidatus Heimdallarchaeota archaeon]|nr:MAG: hypothetical protein DRO91_08235 [Candidatus Heimdallarchaeota archaeon]
MKCQRKAKYIYYCEDCSGTYCFDCLITEKKECTFCKDCGYISWGKTCEKCGKQNHIPATKKILKCPMCNSTKLKEIGKKTSNLPTEFYDAIDALARSLESIQKFAHKFSELVTNIKQIRRDRFCLYPSIESGLIQIQKSFSETKYRASEILDKVSEHIYKYAKELSFNRNISIYQLSKIDKIIKMIKTHAISYCNLIDDFLSKPQKELLEIEEKIAELKNYMYLFDEVAEKFEPEVYELKVAAFPNVKLTFPGERRKKGTLFITNKRIYYLPEYHFIFRFTGKVRSLSLNEIKEAEQKKTTFFGNKMVLRLGDKEKIKLKTSEMLLEQIQTIFSYLFYERERFLITDLYFLESFNFNLDYHSLQEKIDRRINDLKQTPFTVKPENISGRDNSNLRDIFHMRENDEVKQLRIELKAAQDTLRELIKAFNDRSITPEVYFSRREKTKQKILTIEAELEEARQKNYRMNGNLHASLI